MIIEQLALWGDEATQEHPATFTTYLADPMPEHEDARRPAAIICGGGSFTHVGVHEKEPVALAFLQAGYQAFTLDYVTSSTGDVSYPNPEADLARMVATVRANAADWRVDPARVAVVGFSAGGFVCASLATSWRGNALPKLVGAPSESIRPDAVVLGYPALDYAHLCRMQLKDPRIDLRVPKTGGKTGRDLLNDYGRMIAKGEPTDDELLAALDSICPTMHVDRHVPPVFMWGTADDDTAPVAQLYPFAQRLAESGVVHELHVFDRGGHSRSVANANSEHGDAEKQEAVRPWFNLALSFLARVM